MNIKRQKSLARFAYKQSGYVLISALILLLLGGLALPPLLSYLSMSLKTGEVYRSKTDELYAADSGVEDAIWQIKYDRLTVLFDDPVYDIYDYTTIWPYTLSESINNLPVDVTVQNVWITRDITPPAPDEARQIIESNKLMVAGTAPDETSYQIKISFYPGTGEENSLLIDSLGYGCRWVTLMLKGRASWKMTPTQIITPFPMCKAMPAGRQSYGISVLCRFLLSRVSL